MDELTFLLILAGVGVVLLVAMFTYYKHHKKINNEISGFSQHVNAIDDVLLDENSSNGLIDRDLPSSFTASRNENFYVDDINLGQESFVNKQSQEPQSKEPVTASQPVKTANTNNTSANNTSTNNLDTPSDGKRELVDGVYINTKRVISSRIDDYQSKIYKDSDTSSLQQAKPINSFAPIKKEQEAESPLTDEGLFAEVSQSDNTQESERPPSVVKATQAPQEKLVSKRKKMDVPKTTRASQKISVVYDPMPDGVDKLIISHTILSKSKPFSGVQLFQALESAGLVYGEMKIYHYPCDESPESFALFSIANVVEPGTFDPQNPDALKTPGISMFMRLPTRMDNYEAYKKFIHVAQMIAAELDGELCDETRSQLTQQAISYKKEQIRKLNFAMVKAEKLSGNTH